MKVLVVGPSTTKSRGGMASVIRDIQNSKLLNDRFQMDVFASCMDGNPVVRRLYSVIQYLRFLRICKHYDVIHIHAASRGSTLRKGLYLRAAKRQGKKVILHIHGGKYMTYYEAASKAMQQKTVGILKSADVVVALSDAWKRTFEETFDLQNCVSVPNGVDTDALSCVDSSRQNTSHFVCMGRLGKVKGTYDLVSAVEKAKETLPELKVYLAGDGEVEPVKNLVAEKGLQDHIEIVGWIGFEKKVELLQQCATKVLPSYHEGLPMAILEAMACGKVILSTPVGAIPEVVRSENGILVNPGDVDALAAAMVQIAKNPEIAQNIAARNIELVKNSYSMKAMHEKLAALYEA